MIKNKKQTILVYLHIVVTVGLLFCGPKSFAYTPLYRFDQMIPTNLAGGDFNGDGFDDILTGSGPDIVIYSGRDGQPLRRHSSGGPNYANGSSVGDLNNDGADDYALQVVLGIGVVVFSGRSGQALLTVPTCQLYANSCGSGQEAVAVGDFDNDGIPDLGIGMSYRAIVVSGRTGAVLLDHPSASPRLTKIAGIGDIDRDGTDEVLIGDESWGANYSGAAWVYSNHFPNPIFTLNGPTTPYQGFGAQVVGLGDVNGDAIPDFAVGDPGAMGTIGNIAIFSGADATLIRRIQGGANDRQFGYIVIAAGDIDGDVLNDLIYVTSSSSGADKIVGVSAATGNIAFEISPGVPGQHPTAMVGSAKNPLVSSLLSWG